MDDKLNQLPLEELKKILKSEMKKFVEGLDNDLSSEELQLIRQRIKEMSGLIAKKTTPNGKTSE
jgi:hypothetical protein